MVFVAKCEQKADEKQLPEEGQKEENL